MGPHFWTFFPNLVAQYQVSSPEAAEKEAKEKKEKRKKRKTDRRICWPHVVICSEIPTDSLTVQQKNRDKGMWAN
jgi:hypothetical protein